MSKSWICPHCGETLPWKTREHGHPHWDGRTWLVDKKTGERAQPAYGMIVTQRPDLTR